MLMLNENVTGLLKPYFDEKGATFPSLLSCDKVKYSVEFVGSRGIFCEVFFPDVLSCMRGTVDLGVKRTILPYSPRRRQ